jgi:hypothetical protein
MTKGLSRAFDNIIGINSKQSDDEIKKIIDNE